MSMTVRPTRALAAVLRSAGTLLARAATLCVVVACCGCGVDSVPEGAPRAFDAEEWNADGAGASGVRFHMIDDLLIRHPLRGMPLDDVKQILGKPDRLWGLDRNDHVRYQYNLGWTEVHDIPSQARAPRVSATRGSRHRQLCRIPTALESSCAF